MSLAGTGNNLLLTTKDLVTTIGHAQRPGDPWNARGLRWTSNRWKESGCPWTLSPAIAPLGIQNGHSEPPKSSRLRMNRWMIPGDCSPDPIQIKSIGICPLELQRSAVDAVALPCGSGAVLEHMAQVSITTSAEDLGADHPVGAVFFGADRTRADTLPETGPTGA